MDIPNALAFLVVFVAMPLNWLVAALLVRLSLKNPSVKVLRDRAIVAVALAIIMTVFGFIFVNNDLTPPPFSLTDTKILTRATLLTMGTVPALYWLWLYLKGKR